MWESESESESEYNSIDYEMTRDQIKTFHEELKEEAKDEKFPDLKRSEWGAKISKNEDENKLKINSESLLSDGYLIGKLLTIAAKDGKLPSKMVKILASEEYNNKEPDWTPKPGKKEHYFTKTGYSSIATASSYHHEDIRKLREIVWKKMVLFFSDYVTREPGYNASSSVHIEQLLDQITHVNKASKPILSSKVKDDSTKFIKTDGLGEETFFTGFVNLSSGPVSLNIYKNSHNYKDLQTTKLKTILSPKKFKDGGIDKSGTEWIDAEPAIKEQMQKIELISIVVQPGEFLLYNTNILYIDDGIYNQPHDVILMNISFRLATGYSANSFRRNGGVDFFKYQFLPKMNNGIYPVMRSGHGTRTKKSTEEFESWTKDVIDESLWVKEKVTFPPPKGKAQTDKPEVKEYQLIQTIMPSMGGFELKKNIFRETYAVKDDNPYEKIEELLNTIKEKPEHKWNYPDSTSTNLNDILSVIFKIMDVAIEIQDPYMHKEYTRRESAMYYPVLIGNEVTEETEALLTGKATDSDGDSVLILEVDGLSVTDSNSNDHSKTIIERRIDGNNDGDYNDNQDTIKTITVETSSGGAQKRKNESTSVEPKAKKQKRLKVSKAVENEVEKKSIKELNNSIKSFRSDIENISKDLAPMRIRKNIKEESLNRVEEGFKNEKDPTTKSYYEEELGKARNEFSKLIEDINQKSDKLQELSQKLEEYQLVKASKEKKRLAKRLAREERKQKAEAELRQKEEVELRKKESITQTMAQPMESEPVAYIDPNELATKISRQFSIIAYLNTQKLKYTEEYKNTMSYPTDGIYIDDIKQKQLENIGYFMQKIGFMISEEESTLERYLQNQNTPVNSKQTNSSSGATMVELSEKMNNLQLVKSKTPLSNDYERVGDKMVPYSVSHLLPRESEKIHLDGKTDPIDIQVSKKMKSLSMPVPWQGTILYDPRHLGMLNSKYRRVITTTPFMQVVLTAINHEMNEHVNDDAAVFLSVIQGKMKVSMWMEGGVKFKTLVLDNQCIVIPAGVVYKIKNGCPCSKKITLKFFAVYSKPIYSHNVMIEAKRY